MQSGLFTESEETKEWLFPQFFEQRLYFNNTSGTKRTNRKEVAVSHYPSTYNPCHKKRYLMESYRNDKNDDHNDRRNDF